jgi:Peptidase family M28
MLESVIMQINRRWLFVSIPVLLGFVVLSGFLKTSSGLFDGARAYKSVETQLSFGPRIPGSEAHRKVIDYILSELQQNGWQPKVEYTTIEGHPVQNIVASRGESGPWVILGAHYDSRLVADKDPNPDNRSKPVPGANDGASGVAILLELSRILPKSLDKKVTLVFFDLEDQGKIPGWDWILGSEAFIGSHIAKPDAVLVVDMVGDKDLHIFQERNSDRELSAEIWNTAEGLGYSDQFIPELKYSILDDHIPFLNQGIPAVDIIDLDYPYHHTTEDDLNHVSARSLTIVGKTLFKWFINVKYP